MLRWLPHDILNAVAVGVWELVHSGLRVDSALCQLLVLILVHAMLYDAFWVVPQCSIAHVAPSAPVTLRSSEFALPVPSTQHVCARVGVGRSL